MIDYPKTRAEAECTRYRVWGGSPKGSPYNPKKCAMEVHDASRSCLFHQCNNKPGHGSDNLYCKMHANIVNRAAKGETK
jgi:hypothetical protein